MLTIVTGNQKKYEQLAQYVPASLETRQLAIDIPEIQTHLLTDISSDKCVQAYNEVQWPVLVDDSGIYFDAYHEFPGALTKFLYQGIWLEGIQKLFTDVTNTKATFQCVLSYMDDDTSESIQFVGETQGHLDFSHLWPELEDKKIPYDLIFVPDGMDVPAFFDMEWRNETYNHRVRAVKKFSEWISIDK